LFLNLSNWLPQIAEATPAFASSVVWLRPGGFLQPDRKITRRKRRKRIQRNVHRIGVAGEI
jgi:hypothetical protein